MTYLFLSSSCACIDFKRMTKFVHADGGYFEKLARARQEIRTCAQISTSRNLWGDPRIPLVILCLYRFCVDFDAFHSLLQRTPHNVPAVTAAAEGRVEPGDEGRPEC